MPIKLSKFLKHLADSRLMDESEVRTLRESLPASEAESAEAFVKLLLKRGRLNRYQAKRIAAGKTRGLVLGNNVIVGRIGQGGMGEVFLAEHRRMKRPVVVKVLPEKATESEDALKRFQREVEAAAQLSHPNIVTAFDADEEDGVHYLVMEYVDGCDLGTLVNQQGTLSVEQTVDIVLQAARGLQYAHQQGVIHRDIKPDNLFLDRSGTIKILDMGLARFDHLAAAHARDETNLTSENQIVGTVDYMSPEQADNSSQVDRTADVYSLGCTMFRLLAGRPPYEGTSPFQTLIFHRANPIPRIRDLRPDVPEQLETILSRMLAKQPGDRFPSMTELIRHLEPLARDAPLASHSLVAIANPDSFGTSPTRLYVKDSAKVHGDSRPESPDEGGESSVLDDSLPAGDRYPPLPYPAVGIDLGTTYSAVAYLDDLRRPQTVSNAEGDKITPSVVLLEDNEAVVGKEALKAMATEMQFVAQCAKRDLGEKLYHKSLGDQQFPPEVLQAWVLNKLREDARHVIGPFQKVVITVPAYFDETRRKATQDAGYIAGFEVLDIINEPTAAAVAYGFYQGHLAKQTGTNLLGKDGQPLKVLVYDLGGGTFDVTLMEIGGGHFKTIATDGDVRLGGHDWDARLIDYVCTQFLARFGEDPRRDLNAFGKLWRECEDAKRTLSARNRTSISCDFAGYSMRVTVTRDQFRDMTSDLLDRTAFTVEQTLKHANLKWSDIDRVLLVGGSTRMPAVGELIKSLSGKEPDRSVSPDEAIAHGAALHAGLQIDRLQGRSPAFAIENVNSHSLGVVGTDLRTGRKHVGVLIPRNTLLPAKAVRAFHTSKPGQRSILVVVVEGESRDPDECALVGTCKIDDLPPDLPAKTPIKIRFRYEENGRLTISVKVASADHFVERQLARKNRMTQSQLDWWREQVSGRTD